MTVPRILVVDDDSSIRRAYTRTLELVGWQTEVAADGEQALLALKAGAFDVILSDVSMPNMGGLEFLRAVRQLDLDVPVILMTGAPELDSAIDAINYGAFRYLLKPMDQKPLIEALQRAIDLHGMARLKRQALAVIGEERRELGDRAGLEARFTSALQNFWMAYQPIVHWPERRVFGYEALLRSSEPTLQNPLQLLEAAERPGRMRDLSRAIRARVFEDSANAPKGVRLFVNLHSLDLNDEDLYDPTAPLSRIADRVVLEVTERESLDGVKNVSERTQRLRAMGYQIAVDDLGAGYAGLSSYSQLEPEIAKIDMSLVRGIDIEPRKKTIVRSMRELCESLKTLVVAEGIETPGERDALASIGCVLLQGYYFAKPAKGFCTPTF